MIDLEATDFPDPDSPTMANVSPSCNVKLTPRTAETGPANVSNVIFKLFTSNIFLIIFSPSPFYSPRKRGSNASRKPFANKLIASIK